MAGTINYAYDPNQEVYIIATCEDKPIVLSGIVIRIRSEVLVSASKLQYDVRAGTSAGTIVVEVEDIFGDLPSAIAEYQNRLS